MEHYILKTLKEIDGIYEHKFSIKCGREYTKFPELDQLIIDGFIESFDKGLSWKNPAVLYPAPSFL